MTSSPTILFMGTPHFAATALLGLVGAGFNVTSVVCRPDEKSGRGGTMTLPETKIEAIAHKIPVFQPENKAELTEIVEKLKPELIVVAAYGMIIPQAVLDVPKYGALNVHGSLLPKYRGASPISEAILAGNKKTGITIMKMSAGMDEGTIVSSFEFRVSNDSTTVSLTSELAELGAEAIVETIPGWIEGKVKATPQDDSKATYCHKITKEDGHIDWNKPAEQIERMVRAYTPWPTAYTFAGDLRIKIMKSRHCEELCDVAISDVGTLHFENGRIYIGTGNGTLEILELQPEGKKPMSARDFINGNSKLNNLKLT